MGGKRLFFSLTIGSRKQQDILFRIGSENTTWISALDGKTDNSVRRLVLRCGQCVSVHTSSGHTLSPLSDRPVEDGKKFKGKFIIFSVVVCETQYNQHNVFRTKPMYSN